MEVIIGYIFINLFLKLLRYLFYLKNGVKLCNENLYVDQFLITDFLYLLSNIKYFFIKIPHKPIYKINDLVYLFYSYSDIADAVYYLNRADHYRGIIIKIKFHRGNIYYYSYNGNEHMEDHVCYIKLNKYDIADYNRRLRNIQSIL